MRVAKLVVVFVLVASIVAGFAGQAQTENVAGLAFQVTSTTTWSRTWYETTTSTNTIVNIVSSRISQGLGMPGSGRYYIGSVGGITSTVLEVQGSCWQYTLPNLRTAYMGEFSFYNPTPYTISGRVFLYCGSELMMIVFGPIEPNRMQVMRKEVPLNDIITFGSATIVFEWAVASSTITQTDMLTISHIESRTETHYLPIVVEQSDYPLMMLLPVSITLVVFLVLRRKKK